MAQANKENYTLDPANTPVKRKRGRPRKDESLRSRQATNNQLPQVNPTSSSSPSLEGQQVSGVIAGKFEAGYLLSVKVGTGGPILHGVVFEPSMYNQITRQNDLFPFMEMSGGHGHLTGEAVWTSGGMLPRTGQETILTCSHASGNNAASVQPSNRSEPSSMQKVPTGTDQRGVANNVADTTEVILALDGSSEAGHGPETSNPALKESNTAEQTSPRPETAGTQQTTLGGSGSATPVAKQASENLGSVEVASSTEAALIGQSDPASSVSVVSASRSNDDMLQVSCDPQSSNEGKVPPNDTTQV